MKIADSNNFAPSASTAAVAGATGTVEAVSPSPTIFPSSSSSSPPPSSPPPPPPSLNEGQQPAQVGKLEKANTTIIPKRLDSPVCPPLIIIFFFLSCFILLDLPCVGVSDVIRAVTGFQCEEAISVTKGSEHWYLVYSWSNSQRTCSTTCDTFNFRYEY